MLQSILLIVCMLGIIAIWAPYAMEEPKKITWSSPWFKSLMGVIFLYAVMVLAIFTDQLKFYPWVSALVLLSFVDLRYRSVRLLDLGIMTTFMIPLVAWQPFIPLVALTGSFFFLLLFVKIILKKIYNKNAFGGADIWVILVILLALGGKPAIIACYTATLFSAMVGLYLIFFKKKSRQAAIPFIPFLTLGVMVSHFFSDQLLKWYQAWLIT